MKRLWDLAREHRPSIYEKPLAAPPLLEGLRFEKERSIIPFGRFSECFRRFISRQEPRRDMDALEAHALIAKAYQNCSFAPWFHIEKEGGIQGHPLTFMFPHALVLWDIAKNRSWARSGINPISISKSDLARLEPAEAALRIMNDYFGSSGFWSAFMPHTYSSHKFSHRWLAAPPSRDIEIRFEPGSKAKLEYALIEGALGGRRDGPLIYPCVITRLDAVIGAGENDSVVANEYLEYKRLDGSGKGRVDSFGFGEGHVSLIALYPWEADHIGKAAEIRKRGIETAEPLGKVFAGEREYALFRWVRGVTLDNIAEGGIWRKYGAVIRACHDRGIRLDDAAGRNAVWNGEKVVLIDFEHTSLSGIAEPLPIKEREDSLARIQLETLGMDRDIPINLMKGYLDG